MYLNSGSVQRDIGYLWSKLTSDELSDWELNTSVSIKYSQNSQKLKVGLDGLMRDYFKY